VTTYKIVRYYREEDKDSEIIKEDLTLEEAKEHCHDPSTSGDDWFDGFVEE